MNGPIPEESKARARELWGDRRKDVKPEEYRHIKDDGRLDKLDVPIDLEGWLLQNSREDSNRYLSFEKFKKLEAKVNKTMEENLKKSEANIRLGRFNIDIDDLKSDLERQGEEDREWLSKKPPTGLRMYFFVMYNLSGIQKGIQAGHAALEYAKEYKDSAQFQDFTENHKTFVLLDGGGSNDMLGRAKELNAFGIKYSTFNEPDLNGSMSAIAFIVPESVYGFDWKAYEESKEFWNPVDDRDMPFRKYLKQFRLAAN